MGGGVSQGKPCLMVEAEGKSREDVKEEELTGDKSSSTHSGKFRAGRTQGAVLRADGAQVDSPTPGTRPCSPTPCTPALSLGRPSLRHCASCSFYGAPPNLLSFCKTTPPPLPSTWNLVFPRGSHSS